MKCVCSYQIQKLKLDLLLLPPILWCLNVSAVSYECYIAARAINTLLKTNHLITRRHNVGCRIITNRGDTTSLLSAIVFTPHVYHNLLLVALFYTMFRVICWPFVSLSTDLHWRRYGVGGNPSTSWCGIQVDTYTSYCLLLYKPITAFLRLKLVSYQQI